MEGPFRLLVAPSPYTFLGNKELQDRLRNVEFWSQPAPVTATNAPDDGGETPGGKPSTVVDLTQPDFPILRPGPVSYEAIHRALETTP